MPWPRNITTAAPRLAQQNVVAKDEIRPTIPLLMKGTPPIAPAYGFLPTVHIPFLFSTLSLSYPGLAIGSPLT
ncbi:MAG TPA: hypothetical protein PLJ27_22880 [Polyangiaceae bacterium]|nr:MAG: hypothetical protein BWY17_02768 [Deltaproteobacteria bacterium ADurb.Bin207]HNS99319.1 hypothetical protein [Polyangiaceae bacterium]HNZ21999.1 hypothetical protein [Polyangiaceae bacterium]HOD25425.1 hypothetical protein [Polyangiaceae bacterium]HOE47307.1 hypothetical protein [Polyangiaceae bacterium]